MTATAPAVNWDNLPLLLTAAEAAPIVRLTVNSLYIMVRQHRIAHLHVGGHVRFDRDAFRRGDIRSHHTHEPPATQPTSHSDLPPIADLPRRRPSPRRLDSAPAAGR